MNQNQSQRFFCYLRQRGKIKLLYCLFCWWNLKRCETFWKKIDISVKLCYPVRKPSITLVYLNVINWEQNGEQKRNTEEQMTIWPPRPPRGQRNISGATGWSQPANPALHGSTPSRARMNAFSERLLEMTNNGKFPAVSTVSFLQFFIKKSYWTPL